MRFLEYSQYTFVQTAYLEVTLPIKSELQGHQRTEQRRLVDHCFEEELLHGPFVINEEWRDRSHSKVVWLASSLGAREEQPDARLVECRVVRQPPVEVGKTAELPHAVNWILKYELRTVLSSVDTNREAEVGGRHSKPEFHQRRNVPRVGSANPTVAKSAA